MRAAVIVAVLLAGSAHAGPRWLRVARRASAVAMCAAMAADGATTQAGAGRFLESTAWLRGPGGHPAVGRVWAVKVGISLAVVIAQEKVAPRHDLVWIALNSGLAVTTARAAIKNARMMEEMDGRTWDQVPGVLR